MCTIYERYKAVLVSTGVYGCV